jgi:hypothetical protein
MDVTLDPKTLKPSMDFARTWAVAVAGTDSLLVFYRMVPTSRRK